MRRRICQCGLLAVVGFSSFMLVYFALGEAVSWVGGGNRPVAVGEEQPAPGAGASSLRGGRSRTGLCWKRGQGDEALNPSGRVQCCVCSRSTGTACVSTTPPDPTAIAVPPSTTTGPGHPQRTAIPTSARVRRVPSPLLFLRPFLTPVSSSSELRDLLLACFVGLDFNVGVSAKGTPTCLHLGFAPQGCTSAWPR